MILIFLLTGFSETIAQPFVTASKNGTDLTLSLLQAKNSCFHSHHNVADNMDQGIWMVAPVVFLFLVFMFLLVHFVKQIIQDRIVLNSEE